MSGTTYLYDESFQVKILAVTVRSPMFLKLYGDVVNPDYFDSEIMRVVGMKILDYFKGYGQPPTREALMFMTDEYVRTYHIDTTIANRLSLRIGEIFETEITDEEFIKDQIVSFGQRQELRKGVLSIIDIIKSPSSTQDDYERARDIVETSLEVGRGVGDLGSNFFDELSNIPERMRNSIRYVNKVPTGISSIDRATRGGPGGGEVFAFIAPAKRGKTTLLVHIGATACWYDRPVFHYVMEINEDDALLKYASRFTGVSQNDIVTGKNLDHYNEEVARLKSQLGRYIKIKYFLPGTATIGTIKSHLTRTMARDGVVPGIIIIDYDEQMKIPSGDPYIEFGKLYNQFSSLSYEMACPLWTASQGNRGSLQSELVRVDQTADSWKKIMKLDGAITVSQSDHMKATNPEQINWFLEMSRRTQDFVLAKCGIDRDLSYVWELSDQSTGMGMRNN